MEINITPKSTRVSMHAVDAPLDVRGFAKSTEGYGNPSFVLVNVREDNSSLDLFLTPQKAEELIVKLQAAISKAIPKCGACGSTDRAMNNESVCADCGSMTTR